MKLKDIEELLRNLHSLLFDYSHNESKRKLYGDKLLNYGMRLCDEYYAALCKVADGAYQSEKEMEETLTKYENKFKEFQKILDIVD